MFGTTVEIDSEQFFELLKSQARLELIESVIRTVPYYNWESIFKAMFPQPQPAEKAEG